MSKSKNFNKENQRLPDRRILILVILIICFLFRQNIYRSSVVYRVVQERIADTLIDAYFERFILTHPGVYDRKFNNIDNIIHVSLKVTADALNFKGEPTLKTDPHSILRVGEANSEGYASFFKVVCTYLIKRYHFSGTYTCNQFIAERTRNGINLQDAIHTPTGGSLFNRNRDIIAIMNLQTGERRFVDPVIYEQFNIVDIIVTNEKSVSSKRARMKSRLFGGHQR